MHSIANQLACILERGEARQVECASAIRAETSLNAEFWEEFAPIMDMDRRAPLAPSDAERVLIERCRNWVGRGAKLPGRMAAYGRLVETEKAIAVTEKFGVPYEAARELMWGFVQNTRHPMQVCFPHYPLGGKLMWSTYSAHDANSADPFHPCNDPASLPNELGLPLSLPGAKARYFVFVYSLPDSVEPRLPTIADAYAGGLTTVRFRPIGRTHARIMYTGTERGRPECVHETINASQLLKPLGALPEPGLP